MVDPTWGHHKWREPSLTDAQKDQYKARLVDDYRQTFETDHGARVLRHLMRVSGMLEMSTYRTEPENLRAEGAANMVRSILMQLTDGDRDAAIQSIVTDNLETLYERDHTSPSARPGGIDVVGSYAGPDADIDAGSLGD
jgi:hypothetical protein